MKQKKKICLLLTGCVRPNIEGDCVAVADVRLRRRQYVEAITWYLDHTPYDVVFCENSNTDLSDEFHGRKDAARLEVLTYFKGGGVKPEARATRRWRYWNTSTSTHCWRQKPTCLSK